MAADSVPDGSRRRHSPSKTGVSALVAAPHHEGPGVIARLAAPAPSPAMPAMGPVQSLMIVQRCNKRALPPPGGGRSIAFASRRRSGGGDSRTANSVPVAFTPPRLATLADPPPPGEGGAEYAVRS